MEQYSYLLINFFTIIICFVFSFHPRLRFDKYFLPFIKAAVLVASVFIVWDIWFTDIGVWWFNKRYLTGITLVNLPLEEWMFFIFIPFSCVFTYYCLDKLIDFNPSRRTGSMLTLLTSVVLVILGTIYVDRLYTVVTFFSSAIILLALQFVVKVNWMAKAFAVYGILLLPFFIVNGILTGTGLDEPIVNYVDRYFIGFRILTVPVEDSVYGFLLFVLNIWLFKYFSGQPQRSPSGYPVTDSLK